MEIPKLDEKYLFKPLPVVNELPEDFDYTINTSAIPEDRYLIKVGEYRNLRNGIIKHLLTFYDRVDYSDASILDSFLSMVAYKDYQLFHFVFYIDEWHSYQQTGIFQEMITQYLAWGISNYHRNDSGTLAPRHKFKHPFTRNSVLKCEINKI